MDIGSAEIPRLAFIKALIEQEPMRVPGDIYNLTQVSLAYNSSQLDGGTLSEDQVRSLYDTQTEQTTGPMTPTGASSRAWKALHSRAPLSAALRS